MFGAKKKQLAAERERIENQIDLLSRQAELSRQAGGSIMGFSDGQASLQNCIETGGHIESCAYLGSLSEPPAIVYHYSEDDEAKLFLVGDVAGRGTPAALIAAYVTGLFEQAAHIYKISGGTSWIGKTLLEMNQRVVEKNFIGRFVAINVILVWKRSGTSYLWSMGGFPIYLFRKSTGKLKSYEINNTPALGIFDSYFFKMQAGDSLGPKKITLRKDDYLLLIDNGFDESSRPQSTKPQEETQEEPQEETEEEEFGVERVEQVLKAALTGGKVEIPAPDHSFQWRMNMEGVAPAPKNVLLSLVAAEKLFRLSPINAKSSTASAAAKTSTKKDITKTPAKATTEIIQLLGKLVENENFPVGADKSEKAGKTDKTDEAKMTAETDGPESPQHVNEEHTITGYTELPQRDEQFALAIRRG